MRRCLHKSEKSVTQITEKQGEHPEPESLLLSMHNENKASETITKAIIINNEIFCHKTIEFYGDNTGSFPAL